MKLGSGNAKEDGAELMGDRVTLIVAASYVVAIGICELSYASPSALEV